MQKFRSFLSYYNQLLKPEGSYFAIAIIYGIAVSIITLAIPISVQALVNTIAFGVLVQPLVILTVLLLSLLIISSILKALQTFIIEIFQRHFFIRISTDIAENIMMSGKDELSKHYGVELVNRYFDIMTVQKKATTLITGGVSLVLQIVLGLILLAFYHPYFLVFDIILISLLAGIWFLFGSRAMKTAVEESDRKYKLAYWLEEIARESTFFKRQKYKKKVYEVTDSKVYDYIGSRKDHFKLLFIQIVLLLISYSFLSALILGLGGFLVISGELSLGQLVAAELIVTVILAGLSGAGKYLEDFYDLYAALSKISSLYKLKPAENLKQEIVEIKGKDLLVKFDNETLNFEHGKSYLLQSKFYSSKLSFIDMIRGFTDESRYKGQFGNRSYEELCAFQVNDFISVIKEPHFFYGTLFENLTFGLEKISIKKVEEVLEVVDLQDMITALPDGLDTEINPAGYPLWPSQLIRLTIAREILVGTKVIVAVDVFEGLEKKRRRSILKYLIDQNITLIVLSNQNLEGFDFDGYYFLNGEEIVSCDSGRELSDVRRDHE